MPFIDDQVNQNSYNYRIGNTLLEVTDAVLDTRKPCSTKQIHIPKKGLLLKPNKLYLGVTYEKIGSSKYVPSLIGRSSLGRLGLFLQITADLGHLGTEHKWTLELKCVQPLRIYPRMIIGQVSFWKPSGLMFLKTNYLQKKNHYAQFSKPQVTIVAKFN